MGYGAQVIVSWVDHIILVRHQEVVIIAQKCQISEARAQLVLSHVNLTRTSTFSATLHLTMPPGNIVANGMCLTRKKPLLSIPGMVITLAQIIVKNMETTRRVIMSPMIPERIPDTG